MRIGVDLGGTKIEAALLDEAGTVRFRRRIEAPQQDYAATVAAVAGLVKRACSEAGGDASVGIGIPGTISPATGLVKNANSTWLNGQPLDRDLGLALGRPVRIANDANCFALSEAVDGAAAGAHAVFGVILGTGVGGGLVIGGRVLAGANAIAGEWGHNPLPWPTPAELPGPACWCGRRGCIETWSSGPALARTHMESTGQYLTASEIAERAAAGNAEAGESMAQYEERLARALAHTINIFDPDIIVLGGGLSNITRLYENLPRLWEQWVFSDQVATRIVPPLHGDSSGVRGAAWLWREEGGP
ncbi:MAG: ROK family protein [Alphaproteobacteria bacterium]|nr:ROK family protein [Alphaproteobacteria bacterium]